jgi:hypothetical protein
MPHSAPVNGLVSGFGGFGLFGVVSIRCATSRARRSASSGRSSSVSADGASSRFHDCFVICYGSRCKPAPASWQGTGLLADPGLRRFASRLAA